MYNKRLRAYKKIGYSLFSSYNKEEEQVNAIYDFESYLDTYSKDVISAEKSIVISSPALSYKKVNRFIKYVRTCQERGVKVTVITWDPEEYGYGDPVHRIEMINSLTRAGITVELMKDSCQHYAIIDNNIVWYGSMNLLSKEDVEDNIMRVVSSDIAAEILDITFGQ